MCDVASWLPNNHPILNNQQPSTAGSGRVADAADAAAVANSSSSSSSRSSSSSSNDVRSSESSNINTGNNDNSRKNEPPRIKSSAGAPLAVAVIELGVTDFRNDRKGSSSSSGDSSEGEGQAPDTTANNSIGTSARPLTLKVCNPVLSALKRYRRRHQRQKASYFFSLWPRQLEVYRGACGWGPPPPSSLSAGLYQGAVGFVAQSSQVPTYMSCHASH